MRVLALGLTQDTKDTTLRHGRDQPDGQNISLQNSGISWKVGSDERSCFTGYKLLSSGLSIF